MEYASLYWKDWFSTRKDQGKRVVIDLVDGLAEGRGVTTDNFFTSYGLSQELLRKKLSLVGTLRKNRSELPPISMPSKEREVNSSIYAFRDDACLVSYVPKRNKAIILLSTFHNKIENANDETKKPKIILHYNQTKVGVDVMDQMVKRFTTRRATKRWPLALFENFLDISGLNSLTIWANLNPNFAENNKSFFFVN